MRNPAELNDVETELIIELSKHALRIQASEKEHLYQDLVDTRIKKKFGTLRSAIAMETIQHG